MERTLNFKKDVANYVKELMAVPGADKVVRSYERGLITMEEALRGLHDNKIELMKTESEVAKNGGIYIYGMRLRPAGIACQPKEGFLGRLTEPSEVAFLRETETSRYHDVISYERKLSEDEVRHYSLDYLGTLVGGVA